MGSVVGERYNRDHFFCVSRNPFADGTVKREFNIGSRRVTIINRAVYERALQAANKKLREALHEPK